MQIFDIQGIRIGATGRSDAARICYVLSPFDDLGEWAEEAAGRYGLAIAVVSQMDWDNDLTPWPAKGVPAGSPDFEGRAPEFLKLLTGTIVPAVERRLGISRGTERTLCGVSLSGLFTLWQWLLCDEFRNIISLSGSFWYEGFAAWAESRAVPAGKGRAYFLLGNKEAQSPVPQFRPVQTDTETIVNYLKAKGISATFELVPGNHYQNALPRLDRAFTRMFPANG